MNDAHRGMIPFIRSLLKHLENALISHTLLLDFCYPPLLGLGNIISLCSAMFLCGPKRQFKKMFDDTRRMVTIVYLSTLAASIILCLIKFDKDVKLAILIVLLITQFFSSIWYSLSYIPLARRAVKKFFRQQVDDIV